MKENGREETGNLCKELKVGIWELCLFVSVGYIPILSLYLLVEEIRSY
jgi:hypothetical protein